MLYEFCLKKLLFQKNNSNAILGKGIQGSAAPSPRNFLRFGPQGSPDSVLVGEISRGENVRD